jgi:hypothetical protein
LLEKPPNVMFLFFVHSWSQNKPDFLSKVPVVMGRVHERGPFCQTDNINIYIFLAAANPLIPQTHTFDHLQHKHTHNHSQTAVVDISLPWCDLLLANARISLIINCKKI